MTTRRLMLLWELVMGVDVRAVRGTAGDEKVMGLLSACCPHTEARSQFGVLLLNWGGGVGTRKGEDDPRTSTKL